MMQQFKTHSNILSAPLRPVNLPEDAYWLSGEGCGSWFMITQCPNHFNISRYSPNGELECEGEFRQVDGVAIDLKTSYQFTYLSHCAEVNIIQNNYRLTFKAIPK